MISARPNINGNTRRDFADAHKAIGAAKYAIHAARVACLEKVTNGRNYQHLGRDGSKAAATDRTRIYNDTDIALAALDAIAEDLVAACGEHNLEAA
jgi:hypothetical protein